MITSEHYVVNNCKCGITRYKEQLDYFNRRIFMGKKQQRKSRGMVMPDAYIIIFSIVILMAIATYIIPAAEYERETVDGITKVVPGSYSTIESNQANLLDIFKAVQVGMIESANIIFLIFIIGGIVHVIDSTGAINSGINALIVKTKGRYMLLIASVAGIFGVLASVRSEERRVGK